MTLFLASTLLGIAAGLISVSLAPGIVTVVVLAAAPLLWWRYDGLRPAIAMSWFPAGWGWFLTSQGQWNALVRLRL